jgi:hypothetical protein
MADNALGSRPAESTARRKMVETRKNRLRAKRLRIYWELFLVFAAQAAKM